MTTRRLPGLAARRERLGRERTAAQLRRQEVLEAEVVEQLEPLLGPAGRPVGDTAMTLWRRRRVDAYLALPPLDPRPAHLGVVGFRAARGDGARARGALDRDLPPAADARSGEPPGVLVAVLAILGPGQAAPPAGRLTPAARHADLAVVGQTLRAECASPVTGDITAVGDRRYRATLADGSVVTVAIDRSHGFGGGGSRGILSGGVPACSEAP